MPEPDYTCINLRLAKAEKSEGIIPYFEFFPRRPLNKEKAG
ncbi:hypothetical protein PEDI_00570 [Persicobacter diffluens]|uniref:Uncharacterized protein n=1 Tax=Persicobacter diffluens TaxID=981 RepID=A0AAN4VVD0_9BACT|nr:hypothetical protein PEDI_00570 [Persicobacter diffluens]